MKLMRARNAQVEGEFYIYGAGIGERLPAARACASGVAVAGIIPELGTVKCRAIFAP